MPRKKPFSSKQKRLQLQQKRHKKREREEGRAPTPPPYHGEGESSASGSESEPGEELPQIDKLNKQPTASDGTKYDPNRYKLHFERESQEEIEQRKMKAKTLPLTPVSEAAMEVCVEDIYHPGSVLDIPKRPPWGYHMTKEEVEGQEAAMFEHYLATIHSLHRVEELSYFEHNLEALHFSPALYKHVVEDLKKTFVLVLNKVDLVPPQVAVAWRHYFLSKYPELSVISFTCHPNPEASLQPSEKVSLKFRRGRRGRLPSAVGPIELFKVIETMYRNTVDLAGWQQKLDRDSDPQGAAAGSSDDTSGSDSEEEGADAVAMETTTMTSSPLVRDDVSESVLTIGMVGHPNVGKSSLLNGLMGKKMVSTSRTPGHTKHFQTIFLTHSIRLCDCPGLVFPSLVNRQLQILSGMYPVAQVREPYTAVGYLAERVPLVQLLRLEHPNSLDALVSKNAARSRTRQLPPSKEATSVGKEELRGAGARSNDTPLERDHDEMWPPSPSALQGGEVEEEWTAWDVCDAWAAKRSYFTSRAARHDTYRAANSILRLAVDGRIVMYFRPPGFSREKANWECHSEVADMIQLQRMGLQGAPGEMGTEGRGEEERSPMTGGRQGHQENKFALLMQMEDADT